MVAEIGLEPMTYRVWTDCSSQLSYPAIFDAHFFERLDIISQFFYFVNTFFKSFFFDSKIFVLLLKNKQFL